jgi:hypothetical protein
MLSLSKTKVVNINKEKYDVLICRPSIWGNPFTHIKNKKTNAKFIVNTRKEAIQKYSEWILTQPHLLQQLNTLKGKKLGCYCAPKSCHGDILVKMLEDLDKPKFQALF